MFVQFLKYIYDIIVRFFSFLFTSDEKVLFGDGVEVKVGDCIGEGAFSFVYKVTSSGRMNSYASGTSNMHTFAMKKILMQSELIAKSVDSEIIALRKFNHPNIVKLLDCAIAPSTSNSPHKTAYLLFPFAERGTLRTILNDQQNGKSRKLDIIRVLSDFLKIVDAIAVLHEYSHCPYVHQDIKPENVLITESGKPLLTDFGSVREAVVVIHNRNKSIQVADDAAENCTMPYRAPELFDPTVGTTLDTRYVSRCVCKHIWHSSYIMACVLIALPPHYFIYRTDIWSVGCLLFAWWYGYSPYESEFVALGGSGKNEQYPDRSYDISNSNSGGNAIELQQWFEMRVVPCSHLRVLAPVPKHPQHPSTSTLPVPTSSDIVDDLVHALLKGNMIDRPTIREVHSMVSGRIDYIRGNISQYSQFVTEV